MDWRTLNVDFDSYSSVKHYVQQLQSRLKEFNQKKTDALNERRRRRIQNGDTSPLRQQKIFEASMSIYNADISPLFEDLDCDPSPKYYVYAHLRPFPTKLTTSGTKLFAAALGMNKMPFYIGKGTGDRWMTGDRSAAYRHAVKGITNSDEEVAKIKLKTGLTESQALQLEAKLIDIFGIQSHQGLLVNLDEGYKADLRRTQYYPSAIMIPRPHVRPHNNDLSAVP